MNRRRLVLVACAVAPFIAIGVGVPAASAEDCQPAPYGATLCKQDDGSVTVCAAWMGCHPWLGVFPPPPMSPP